MKKIEKVVISAVVAVALLSVFGCSNAASSDSGQNGGGGTSGSANNTDVLKFNIPNASVLATKWIEADNTNRSASRSVYARAAEDNALESLVAISEDGTTVNVMSVPSELGLQAWCKPNPVRELYRCPYEAVEEQAKGVYIVFDWFIDWWLYEDGSKAPNVGALLYVKPNGTVVDILNFDNDVNRYPATWGKANCGIEYMKFDSSGNVYILVEERSEHKFVIYRYNPLNDKVTKYSLDIDADFINNPDEDTNLWLRGYEVASDGTWVFVNAQLNLTGKRYQNNIYALRVNTNEVLTLFENEIDGGWCNGLTYNNATNTLYFYNWTYDDSMEKGGLYVLERRSNGTFNTDDIKRYLKLNPWRFAKGAEKYVVDSDGKAKSNPDYEGFLNYLKKMSCYEGDLNDVEFSLAFFGSEAAQGKVDSSLYREDEAGKPLTDIAAIKYLVETPTVSTDSGADGHCLLTWEFQNEAWGWEENFRTDEDKENGRFAFFLSELLLNKKTGKTAVNDFCFFAEELASDSGGYLFCNDEGIWNFADRGSEKSDGTWSEDYSIAYQLTDRKGNWNVIQPGNLKTLKFYMSDDGTEREETDPWYKLPFAANSTGIAAITSDKKTIYYHSNGVTRDILASDPNKSDIGQIYSFTLNDTSLVYSANKKNGGYLMVSIDLETGEATRLPVTFKAECILSMN